ncbi:hypothetical protein SERLA73DRAFT_79124 [Serpula lacrymans var. lacrymans S7.3]|uniref:Uncharacterized protein n=1 Tax=Serpula lacrymans var. lacrymans (strain S7.3) TaxID=936435 RepID=F8QFC3_SERL3|nr:hypothetical protein SERLA73DRAFT_79124 [Serpula lacrymans var. lacrymans S7.3]
MLPKGTANYVHYEFGEAFPAKRRLWNLKHSQPNRRSGMIMDLEIDITWRSQNRIRASVTLELRNIPHAVRRGRIPYLPFSLINAFDTSKPKAREGGPRTATVIVSNSTTFAVWSSARHSNSSVRVPDQHDCGAGVSVGVGSLGGKHSGNL